MVGAVLDSTGHRPRRFLLPADIATLIPVIDQLKERFEASTTFSWLMGGSARGDDRSGRLCIVLPSSEPGLRQVKEIREKMLSRGGRYHVCHGPRRGLSKDPSPLKVKEAPRRGPRYIVCHNEEQRWKDRHDREAIVAKLRNSFTKGAKSLVGVSKYLAHPMGRSLPPRRSTGGRFDQNGCCGPTRARHQTWR